MSQALLSTLAGASLRSLAVAACVGLVLALLRARPGATQHAAWTAVLLAMLAMPGLPALVPGIALPLVAPWRAPEVADGTPAGSGAGASPAPLAPRVPSSTGPVAGEGTAASAATARTPAPDPGFGARPEPAHATALARQQWAGIEAHSESVAAWAAGLYVTGVLLLLFRMLLSALATRRLLRGARPVSGDLRAELGRLVVLESPSVRGPVALGVLRPRVLLPTGWAEWPADWRAAALAHEREHLQRRDPLVRLLAHLNTCLYWFHPLSWWLEARLRATSEHACDSAGARTAGSPQRYAEILLALSRPARPAGAAWASAGIAAGGRLEWRIDRLLEESATLPPSRWRALHAAAGTALVALVIAACRGPATPPTPLVPNPQLAEKRGLLAAVERLWQEAQELDDSAVTGLEARLAEQPGDLQARQKLLAYYTAKLQRHAYENPRGLPAERESLLAARRRHVLWIVENRPASHLAGSNRIATPEREDQASPTAQWGRLAPADPLADAIGHRRARDLWLAHVADPGARPAVLGNAASFFESSDAPRAERLLLRARRLEPGGRWSRRLGRLYALAEAGDYHRPGYATFRRVSILRPRASPLATRLSATRDAQVLIGAALHYLRQPYASPSSSMADWRRTARSLVERAVLNEPGSVDARALRQQLELGQRWERHGTFDREFALAEQREIVLQLPEADRFALLPELVTGALRKARDAGVDADRNLAGYGELASRQADVWSRDLLELAPRHTGHPRQGAAVYHASMTLAELALKRGERGAAIEHLRRASTAPSCEELAYGPLDLKLLGQLLEAGERESVVSFLERLSETSLAYREALRAMAASIRSGYEPDLSLPWLPD